MKYLLIDGSNLACRCSFANEQLTSTNGIPTGVHFGVLQSLILLEKKFSDWQFLMVWDGKSARRMKESLEAVSNGVVPEGYKENRKKGPQPKPLLDFYAQSPYLQRGIGATGIPQIRLPEFEADDVIASYCKILKNDNEIICITSDKDYRQLLDKNVSIYDAMKQKEVTEKSLAAEYGIQSSQWIDVGALMGDDGDNIFGVPGWGEKTAVKEIKKYGSWEKVIAAYEKEFGELRKKYMDICENEKLPENARLPDARKVFDDFKAIRSDPTNEKSRLKYPDITFDMPYTGVAMAFERGEVKMPKTTLMALMFQKRIKLAYSLKKMDYIESLPPIEPEVFDKKKLVEYLEYYDIHSLYNDIDVFGYERDPNGREILPEDIVEIDEMGAISSLGKP